MSILARISLGGNLGDRAGILSGALARLSATYGISVEKVSRFRETRPVGGPAGQGPFLNAAATLVTNLPPTTLLHRLRSVESEFGRERKTHWGERSLDLDLLLYGEEEVTTPELEVPHPRFALRPFVLDPLEEIAPDAVDPFSRRAVRELRRNLTRRDHAMTVMGAAELRDLVHRELTESPPSRDWSIDQNPARGTFLVLCVPVDGERLWDRTASRRWDACRAIDPAVPPGPPPVPVFWWNPDARGGTTDDLRAVCLGISDA